MMTMSTIAGAVPPSLILRDAYVAAYRDLDRDRDDQRHDEDDADMPTLCVCIVM